MTFYPKFLGPRNTHLSASPSILRSYNVNTTSSFVLNGPGIFVLTRQKRIQKLNSIDPNQKLQELQQTKK